MCCVSITLSLQGMLEGKTLCTFICFSCLIELLWWCHFEIAVNTYMYFFFFYPQIAVAHPGLQWGRT